LAIKLSEYLVKFEAGKPYRQPMIAHWCPACQELHPFSCDEPQTNGAKWEWNGDAFYPTFSPSMNIRVGPYPDGSFEVCHYFLKGGMIEYLGDCTHLWKGVSTPIVPIPDSRLVSILGDRPFG
jgi:hypothetical protein